MVLVVLIDAYCTSAEIDARASGAKVAVALSPLVALCTASSHQGLGYNKKPFFRGIYHDSWCICIITLKEIEFGRFNHKNCVHSRMTAYNIYIYTYIYIFFLHSVYSVYIYILFIYVFIYFYIDLFIYLSLHMYGIYDGVQADVLIYIWRADMGYVSRVVCEEIFQCFSSFSRLAIAVSPTFG